MYMLIGHWFKDEMIFLYTKRNSKNCHADSIIWVRCVRRGGKGRNVQYE